MELITVKEYEKIHGRENLLVEPVNELFICRACKYNNSKTYVFRNLPIVITTHINAMKHLRAHYKYIEMLISSINNKRKIAELFRASE